MSLPKNVLYTNQVESSYARNYNNNIAPQNGTGPYGGGETIIINIPTSRNLVMSGADSVFKFSLNVGNGSDASGNDFIRLDKCGAHGCIKRVRIFHGSTLLSDIDNYNNLVAMMMSLQQSQDSSNGKQNLLAGFNGNNLVCGERLNTAQVAANAVTTTRHYAIPIMNFLTYSDKYVPLFALTGAPLRIEIQLVNTPAEFICSQRALSSFAISNIEYIVNFMELSDDAMIKINAASGNGPITWVVQDYRNYNNTITIAANGEYSIPVPAKFNSLRSLFNSYRSKSSGAITFFPMDSTHFGLDSYTWRMGSRTVPTKPPQTYVEFFSEVIRAIGSISDLNHEPYINKFSYFDKQAPVANNETVADPTLNTISNSFFTGLDCEAYSSSGMATVYQGYNSRTDDIFFIPKYNSSATAGLIRIDTYAYFDQVIVIENGFARVEY